MIPYGRQTINETDIKAVIEALKSDFITTGPKVDEFERKFAAFVNAKYAVAVSSGTAALHIACLAAGLKRGDEVITTPMTFAASANCALYCGAKPVFVDINEQGLIDESRIEEKITDKTKAIIPVDYTGFSCNMERIREIANKYNLVVIEDACHALGGRYKDLMIGDCKYSDMCIFSFHPVKHITTGEGGMITTNSKELYEKLKILRNHGITKDKDKLYNKEEGGWFYEMQELGFNYRITDFQCALGISQLKRIKKFVNKRRRIAEKYNKAFKNNKNIEIREEKKDQFNPYHLYIIKVKDSIIRRRLYYHLLKNNILCQVHYIPIYWHPYYQRLGYEKGLCPKAEEFYERTLSIPIFHTLTEKEQDYVIEKINSFFDKNKKNKERIGIIIQARMGSTRLPGKVMLNLAGKPVLWHVVQRCKKAKVDEVIVATSINKENDIIEKFCKDNKFKCFRGSEDDVLNRYYECAKKYNLSTIIRITADCPLIDPSIINKVISKFSEGKYDYVSNVLNKRTFPRGLDVEAFSFDILKEMNEKAELDVDREHVTGYLLRNQNKYKTFNIENKEDLSYLRLTLDEKKDFELIKIIYSKLYKKNKIFLMPAIINLLNENKELLEINKDVKQKNPYENEKN